MNGFRRRFATRSKQLARRAYSMGRAGASAVNNHAKLWDIGMTVVLKMSSIFFLVPFTVTNPQGLRTLRVAPKYHIFLAYVCNIVGGLRVAWYLFSSFRGIKWYIKGQFTTDATFFAVWFLLVSSAYVGHLMLLHRKEEFVFLCNAATSLNKAFSRTLTVQKVL